MPKQWTALACLLSVTALVGCDQGMHAQTARAIDSVAAIDQDNMAELMLASAEPREAVTWFQQAAQTNPERISLQRGLARSLARSGRAAEAVPVWERVIAHPEATLDDRVELADAHIRNGDWDAAEAALNAIPPTHETFQRYRLEAMVADSRRQWARADSFYEIAVGLTARPASVLNNWGFSKLTRGDPRGAERLFAEALRHDANMFTAKNNLALARAGQRRYELPLIEMTQIRTGANCCTRWRWPRCVRATSPPGAACCKRRIATHPQHFEAAAVALRALQ
jgi:Flp pilus assembly protein TadD